MPLTRRSKIKDAWRHPVGNDLLQNLLRQTGRSERFLENPVIANLSLQNLDRLAGPGFCDMLIETATYEQDIQDIAAVENKAWWKEAVVYQVFVPSFMDADHDGMGDIAGITRRLPYFSSLGVDVLLVWPVLDMADSGCGGVRDYGAIAEEYGSMEDFDELVQAAHARDIKVILGIDIASTSDEHPWFARALAGEKAGYYYLRPGTADAPPNNWSVGEGRHAWRWYGEVAAWGLQLGGRRKMDLNWDNQQVREEMAGVLTTWLSHGVDGFMLGKVNLLSKGTLEDGSPAAAAAVGNYGYERYAYSPRLHRYLRELRAAVPEEVLLAGEASGVGTELAKLFTGDCRGELDMVLDGSHLAAKPRGRSEEMGLDLTEIKRYYLRWMQQYGTAHWMTLFLETPDTPRIVSRFGASPLYRTILAKLLGTMLLTLRGTPMIYQGGELGLANTRFTAASELKSQRALAMYEELRTYMGEGAALQKVLTVAPDHARTPMPWSAGAKAGFTGAVPWMRIPDGTEFLNVAAQMEDAGSVWRHYQNLIAVRKSTACLVYGSFNPVFIKNKNVFCYFRIFEGEKWYVEMNLTEKTVARPGRISRTQKLVLSNYDTPLRALRPYEANLYRCD